MNTVLVGAQWGDEGKGKVIDFLTEEADVVVRFQGGSNAGHTVVVGDKKYVLHLVPSGVLHDGKHCVIGNGVVMDPFDLMKELEQVESWGFELKGRFHISERAHMVMQWHRAIDKAEEAARPEGHKIGTTGRGIGPAYAAKVGRYGMRVGDILKPDFLDLVRAQVAEANRALAALGAQPLDPEEMVKLYTPMVKALMPYVTDTIQFLHENLDEKKSILFEGAQATMLDIDFGTYPFVTSSNPTAGGACTGSGVPPRAIDRVIGVLKLYTTRVGEGPFPAPLRLVRRGRRSICPARKRRRLLGDDEARCPRHFPCREDLHWLSPRRRFCLPDVPSRPRGSQALHASLRGAARLAVRDLAHHRLL